LRKINDHVGHQAAPSVYFRLQIHVDLQQMQ